MIIGDLDAVVRILIVGPLAYVSLIVILRVSGKRTLSKMNAFDFVVTVALGSLLATVLLDSSVGVVEGVAAMSVLVVGQYVVSWLSVRSDRVERAVKAEPTLVLVDGRPLPEAMRRMRVTRRDIDAAAREAGVDSTRVAEMILEPAGTLSVVVDEALKNQ
ncbi:MAG: YetF domain-containing protein [Acidimicrobiia bacterium]